jgi:hypothetical protein
MCDKYMDEPDEYERRDIDRHPLTQRLNRELLDSFRRNSRLREVNAEASTVIQERARRACQAYNFR